ncbi:MAG: hypothetical protein V4597_20120 [Pseudomonadota bacterium]
MDIWPWLISHLHDMVAVLGPFVFTAALLTLGLPVLIARTPHAKSQTTPVPAFPLFPWQHFRFWGYVFSHEAWEQGGRYQRALLLLFRTALLVGVCSVTLVFAVSVAAQLQAAP